MSKKNYKNCAVPLCKVTTTKNPDKLFFSSPSDPIRRNAWLKAMRRNPSDLSPKTNFFVCEDHFDLGNDLENCARVQLYKGNKKKKQLTENVIPHRFDCQPDKSIQVYGRKYPTKKGTSDVVEQILLNQPDEIISNEIIQNPSTSHHESRDESRKLHDKGVQVNLHPCFRSIGVQTCTAQYKNAACSPLKLQTVSKLDTASSTTETSTSGSELDENDISMFTVSSAVSDVEESTNRNALLSTEVATFFCKNKPLFYIGIPENCLALIEILKTKLNCSERDIFIVLQKIRLNITFGEIADKFGMPLCAVSRIFAKFTPRIALCLKSFVFWPSPQTIKLWLPIPFRMNFNTVQCIIDCMEIEIEKPSDPVLQTLTWSEYKKTNTIKYLIGITPNGFVSYLSEGYGGRSSDMEIVKQSSFLENITPGCVIMADRGFKGIDTILNSLGGELVRPPSTTSDEKLTKEQVIKTKVIASLRVHIERAIRRLREFKFIKPHSCVNNNLIKYLDYVIIIAAALSNVQKPLIKFE